MSSKLKLNRDSVRRYIAQNIFSSIPNPTKQNGAGNRIGIELEIFVFAQNENNSLGLRPVSLYENKGAFGEMLANKTNPRDVIRKCSLSKEGISNNEIVDTLIYDDGDQIRFEPGAQLEIITKVCGSLKEVEIDLTSKQEFLRQLSSKGEFSFLQYGTNPWFTPDDIKLQLHFPRYQALEKYLKSISTFGRQMMFQTCSMHLNFDFGETEAITVKRYVAANLLVPFATAMFSNSAIIGGQSSGFQSYRGKIWQKLDSKRTGIAPLEKVTKTWNINDLIDDYTEFALHAPIIFIYDHPEIEIPNEFTLNDWLEPNNLSIEPNESHLRNHLTLLFPYIRPKGYLEIRTTDAPPIQWQMIPALFYYAILYSDNHLNKVLDLLVPEVNKMQELLNQAVYGYDSDKIYLICKQLMQIALEACGDLGPDIIQNHENEHLKDFIYQYIDKRRTFSESSVAQIFDRIY